MGSKIMYKEELKDLANTLGLVLVNGEIDSGSGKNNRIEIPNQEEFVDFHKHVEVKVLFYSYTNLNQDIFIIPEGYYEGYIQLLQEQLNIEFQEHNEYIKKLDFEKPVSLVMYFIKDGFLFYNYSSREEIDELLPYDEMTELIVEEITEQLPEESWNEIKDKSQAEKDKKEQELKELVFLDPKFKEATNDTLRRVYTAKFFDKSPKARELVNHLEMHPNIFIEMIWKEFKAKGLHK